MKTKLSLFILILLLQSPVVECLRADELVVIANSNASTNKISQTEVADLYLGRSAPNTVIVPYDREDVELRKNFYKNVTGLSLANVRAYWAKRVFTGRGRPPKILNQEQVAKTIKADLSAITYASKINQPNGSKIVLAVENGNQ